MNTRWEAEEEFQNNVVQVEKWQRRAKYKFGAVVILFCVAATAAFGMAVMLGSMLRFGS